MLSLWCRTAGSRASCVGAQMDVERCDGVKAHRCVLRSVIDCQTHLQNRVIVIFLAERTVGGTSSPPSDDCLEARTTPLMVLRAPG